MSGILLASVGNSYGSLPVNIVAPAVTGTATVGQTLSTTNGTWTGAPAPTFSYQWQRNGVNISGATSSTYVLVNADAGNPVRCVVTATNVAGSASANSNATANVAAIVPGAPTIGTATATGTTTATVVYTAPASDGGATITSYTATSTPDSITGTLSQEGSGTITVTGLTGGTAYTFTVTATNSAGTSTASAASNSITTPLAIGQVFGGGFFAGQISTAGTGVADYNLVIAPKSSGENSSKQWKTSDTSTAGTSSVIDGPTNSANMNNASHPAAQFCEGLTIGSFSDWYMPAQNELEVCYFNLKPTTISNSTSSGTNTNAVPSRGSNYTAGTPAQTAATDFQTGNTEAFDASAYWSSTETSATQARLKDFNNGLQSFFNSKGTSTWVRGVRRVAV
jgi:hypothetical protein